MNNPKVIQIISAVAENRMSASTAIREIEKEERPRNFPAWFSRLVRILDWRMKFWAKLLSELPDEDLFRYERIFTNLFRETWAIRLKMTPIEEKDLALPSEKNS